MCMYTSVHLYLLWVEMNIYAYEPEEEGTSFFLTEGVRVYVYVYIYIYICIWVNMNIYVYKPVEEGASFFRTGNVFVCLCVHVRALPSRKYACACAVLLEVCVRVCVYVFISLKVCVNHV